MNASKKKTISAKEILADILNGISDADLTCKYGLSNVALHRIFDKLIAAGILSKADLDERKKSLELDDGLNLDWDLPPATVVASGALTEEASSTPTSKKDDDQVTFRCPACNMLQPREFQTCPQCGVLVDKYFKKKADEERIATEGQKASRRARYAVLIGVSVFLVSGLVALGLLGGASKRGSDPAGLSASEGRPVFPVQFSKGESPENKEFFLKLIRVYVIQGDRSIPDHIPTAIIEALGGSYRDQIQYKDILASVFLQECNNEFREDQRWRIKAAETIDACIHLRYKRRMDEQPVESKGSSISYFESKENAMKLDESKRDQEREENLLKELTGPMYSFSEQCMSSVRSFLDLIDETIDGAKIEQRKYIVELTAWKKRMAEKLQQMAERDIQQMESEEHEKDKELTALAKKYGAEPVALGSVLTDRLGTAFIGKKVLVSELPIADIRQDRDGHFLVISTNKIGIPDIVCYFRLAEAPSLMSGDRVTIVAKYKGKIRNVTVYNDGTVIQKH